MQQSDMPADSKSTEATWNTRGIPSSLRPLAAKIRRHSVVITHNTWASHVGTSLSIAVLLTGAVSLAAVQFLPGKPPLPRSIPLIFLLLALTVPPVRALRCGCRPVQSSVNVPTDGEPSILPSRC